MNKWRKHEFNEGYYEMVRAEDGEPYYTSQLNMDELLEECIVSEPDENDEVLFDHDTFKERSKVPVQYMALGWEKTIRGKEGQSKTIDVMPVYPKGCRISIFPNLGLNDEAADQEKTVVLADTPEAAYRWISENMREFMWEKSYDPFAGRDKQMSKQEEDMKKMYIQAYMKAYQGGYR